MPNLSDLEARYKELGDEIAKLKKREWPEVGNAFYSISNYGDIDNHSSGYVNGWRDANFWHQLRDFLGIFKTKGEAEAKRGKD